MSTLVDIRKHSIYDGKWSPPPTTPYNTRRATGALPAAEVEIGALFGGTHAGGRPRKKHADPECKYKEVDDIELGKEV